MTKLLRIKKKVEGLIREVHLIQGKLLLAKRAPTKEEKDKYIQEVLEMLSFN